MKLAAILEDTLSVGGGFNQALNALAQIHRICSERFDLSVWTTREENLAPLQALGFRANLLKRGWSDRALALIETSQFGRRVTARLGVSPSIERRLEASGADLVYFVSPSSLALGFKRLNYVLTVWDLCHRDQPEFPEVRDAQQFEAREWFYRHSLARALVVLTDSQLLSQRLRERYGADEDRLLAMPFAPSPLLSTTRCDAGAVLTKYEIQPGFFFYPAQFWSHKNHVRLLQAVAQLKAKGVEARLVFAGGDKGNRAHVERVCARLGLVRQVQFLGFVPAEHMSALYSSCLAVVMPTYFGPTNLPPLEAWAHDKPLVYSRHLAAQAGSAALLVDPDSAEDVAAALLQLLEPDRAAHWIEQGRIRLAALNDERERAEARFAQRLEQFALRRECWESQ